MGSWVFPTRLLKPAMLQPSLIGAAVEGGRTLSGDAQYAEMSGGGRWAVEFSDIALLATAQVKAWRALSAALDSGVTPLLVPLADRRHQPLLDPKYSGSDPFGLAIWDEGLTPWSPEEITAAASGAVPVRQTEISFSYTGGAALQGGEHFSFAHPTMGWRLYRITRVKAAAGGSYTVEFRPPLREAVAPGELLNFESPRCTMRLDGEMDAPLEMWRWARASVRFVETFQPTVIESEGG